MGQGNSCNMQAAYVELISRSNTPVPPDEGSGRTLSASPGLDFDLIGVYTGDDESEVIAGTGGTFQGDQPNPSFNIVGPVGAVFFWRFATVGQGTRIEGDTWEITITRTSPSMM